MAVQTIGNITRFVSQIETGKKLINLIDFYGQEKEGLHVSNNFYELLTEATEDSKHALVEIDNEVINQYENIESDNYDRIMSDLNESFIDLTSENGRQETRIRFAILAYLLQGQLKGSSGLLKNNGEITVIGWFKTATGIFRRARVHWSGRDWTCDSGTNIVHINYWEKGHLLWSRNESNK